MEGVRGGWCGGGGLIEMAERGRVMEVLFWRELWAWLMVSGGARKLKWGTGGTCPYLGLGGIARFGRN
jgi:hypothetical protein